MISQLVLGTLCFMVIVTLLSVSLAFLALPSVDAVMGESVPFIIANGSCWLTTSWYLSSH
jgi:hypothetical protein